MMKEIAEGLRLSVGTANSGKPGLYSGVPEWASKAREGMGEESTRKLFFSVGFYPIAKAQAIAQAKGKLL